MGKLETEPRSALLADAPELDLVLVVLRNGSVEGSAVPDHQIKKKNRAL